MPVNKVYRIESIFEACAYYHEKRPDEIIEISYIMLEGVNTSRRDLDQLIHLTNKDYFLVQLLFYNKGKNGKDKYHRISIEKARAIEQYLQSHSVAAYLSVSAGQDIGGACGQMAAGASDTAKQLM